MLLSLLLVTALSQGPQAQSPAGTFEAAVQFAERGYDAEALAAFERLAAANPEDRQARLWIARLQERMGHPDRAEPVFRSLVLEDASNVDALYGTGTTLIALDRLKDAIEMLERAETLAPDNADVLAALGRVHTIAGHSGQAVSYYKRAATIAPTETNQVAYEQAEIANRHRIEVRYSHETFSDSTPDTNFGDIALNLRAGDSLRVFGRGQVKDRFGITESRGGAGLSWTWKGATRFTGQALVASGNVVMPDRDVLGDISYTYHRVTGSGFVRYFDINGAHMTVVSPAGDWWVTPKLWLQARYAISVTENPLLVDKVYGQTGQLRGSYQLRPRIAISIGAARGVEDFDNVTVEHLGEFVATTGSAGVRLQLHSFTWVVGMYEYLRPHAGRTMGRATISLTQGF